ncbi:hypothetical protein B484DRAFT_14243 [Ochromonadaceae sp. CCMP2298]|nr:hypothetical protein B484DRAFT_14243 [Ochromonadaceae sp. CCMP2298]
MRWWLLLVLLRAGTNWGAVTPKPIDSPTPTLSVQTPNTTQPPVPTSKVDKPVVPDRDMLVSFVNGIYHSEAEVKDIAESIESIFRCDVRSFYNPSSGNWIQDAYKAGFELVLRPSDLALSKQLAEHLRKVLSELHPKGRVLHIAHSGGAILTYLAAKYHLTYSEANRIDIVTLGGGRSITHKYFKGRICNYYSRNDPVLLVENRASNLLRRTKNETYEEVRGG